MEQIYLLLMYQEIPKGGLGVVGRVVFGDIFDSTSHCQKDDTVKEEADTYKKANQHQRAKWPIDQKDDSKNDRKNTV